MLFCFVFLRKRNKSIEVWKLGRRYYSKFLEIWGEDESRLTDQAEQEAMDQHTQEGLQGMRGQQVASLLSRIPPEKLWAWSW